MKTCVFAGTFDPFTVGHENVVKKCLNVYDKVIIVIGENPNKNSGLFSEEQKKRLIKACFENANVSVVCFSELKEKFSDFLLKNEAFFYVRGIRDEKDLRFEKEMEQKNKTLYPFVKTEYIYADEPYKNISSTLVKRLIKEKKSVKEYIPCLGHAVFNELLKEKQADNPT